MFLLVLFLVGTSNYIDKNIIGVLLEQIRAEFQVSDTLLGLLSGISFALFYAVLGIPVARWADRSDRKLIMTLSLIAWSATTVLCGLAVTFWQLAAARFAVGAGEAGAIPPAQSLLADYYPATERAQAIGIFMMSATAGYAISLVLGGWITQNYGWRTAFVVVGLFGLVIAPLTYSILREPRHHSKFAVADQDRESISSAAGALLRKRAYQNILASMVLYFMVAYGAHIFIVSAMIRTHHVTVAQAGAVFGIVAAIGAIVGNLGGGAIADRLATRDVAWYARLAGWGLVAALPFFEVALLAPTIFTMAVLLIFSETLMWGIVPPMFAALHLVCGSKRRAMSVAIAFFFANLIGLGLGPVIAGAISDKLAQTYGSADGLRYSLMIVMTVFLPAGWFMLRAVRHIKADAED
jgi:predicted MFS family arabinose efflux permease